MYFGEVRDNIMPGTVGTTRNVTDVDYGSLLTEYGYEANTDYVSRWIATHVVLSPLNATEFFPTPVPVPVPVPITIPHQQVNSKLH